jgi:hypothetical protein
MVPWPQVAVDFLSHDEHIGNILADRRRVVHLDDMRDRKSLVTE